jgi:hypothetical protein
MVVNIHSSSHDGRRLEKSQERTSEDGSETHSNRWKLGSPAGCFSQLCLNTKLLLYAQGLAQSRREKAEPSYMSKTQVKKNGSPRK